MKEFNEIRKLNGDIIARWISVVITIILAIFIIMDRLFNPYAAQEEKLDKLIHLITAKFGENEKYHEKVNKRLNTIERAAWKNWPNDRDYLERPKYENAFVHKSWEDFMAIVNCKSKE